MRGSGRAPHVFHGDPRAARWAGSESPISPCPLGVHPHHATGRTRQRRARGVAHAVVLEVLPAAA